PDDRRAAMVTGRDHVGCARITLLADVDICRDTCRRCVDAPINRCVYAAEGCRARTYDGRFIVTVPGSGCRRRGGVANRDLNAREGAAAVACGMHRLSELSCFFK